MTTTLDRPNALVGADPTAAQDDIALLKADHEVVSQLFADYEKTHSARSKRALVAEICTALRVYAQVEEEIFYPELKDALKHRLRAPEVAVEHAGVKVLMAQLQAVEPDGEVYDAKVKVLAEYVRHQVKAQRKGLFDEATAAALDLIDLGARMSARKNDLMARAA